MSFLTIKPPSETDKVLPSWKQQLIGIS